MHGAIALAVVLGGFPAARACGYHDPSSINLGMLNLAYPDALHVRTAVWMAQQDGAIGAHPPSESSDSDSPSARFKAMLRLRETVSALDVLRERLGAALDGRPTPSFAVVLIRPMLWARFVPVGTALSMEPHAAGPVREDVVIVTDEPVIQALLSGRLSPDEARRLGLVKLYGAPADTADVSSLLDGLTAVKAASAAATGHAEPRPP